VANQESSRSFAPRVVAIGGLDPEGGAGLVRDWATARERGALVVLVGSAWTDQSAAGVVAVEPRDEIGIAGAIRRAVSGGCDAVKVGMIATPGLVRAVLDALEGWNGPLVFDPVLAASSGGLPLFAGTAADLAPLLERADLTTPNAVEAGLLTGLTVNTVEEARRAALALRRRGARAVLVKGGHLRGDAVDVLVGPAGETLLGAPRVAGVSMRGTGCALATAITVELARGAALPQAVRNAKEWLLGKLQALALA
jgi:hydroxymethylpyrimidine/phosphomethylpyrimidine kinase